MPGVLIVEAMAQLAGLLLLRKLELTGRVPVLLSIDRVKFRRAVVPGRPDSGSRPRRSGSRRAGAASSVARWSRAGWPPRRASTSPSPRNPAA